VNRYQLARQPTTVASIFTAYILRHAAWTAGPAQRAQVVDRRPHPWSTCLALRPGPDIHAAMTVLGRLVSPEEDMAAVVGRRLQLLDTDLRGAFLVGANLQDALLGGAHLQGASLRGRIYAVRFSCMYSSSNVSLHSTDLRGADLRCAQLQGS
jgi:hypothetical protein